MAVQLLIKSPNQQVEDLKIDCDATWTVGQVKEHLCSLYPTKPNKEEQKLIYGGRLLPNHLLLQDVIHQVDGVHTLHLVCPQSMRNNTESVKNQNAAEQDFSELSSALYSDGIRQRLIDAQQPAASNVPPPQFNFPQVNAVSLDSTFAAGYMSYQMAAMQQMYAQLMTQCFTQGHPGYVNYQMGTYSAPTAIPFQTPLTIPTNVPEEPVNPNPVPEIIPEQRPLNNNEDELLGQDLLDWAYIMTRVAILLTILYFHSSFGRVMFVASLGLLVCIYRAGVFERRNQGANRPATVAEEQQSRNPRAQGDVDHDSEHAPPDTSSSSTDTQDEQSISPALENEDESQPISTTNSQNIEPSTFSVLLTFVTTLFTSLIPEHPEPVTVN